MQKAIGTTPDLILLSCVFVCVFCAAACSIPNLESTACSEARIAARKFYSFHFGNDMRPVAENLKLREKFLTARYYSIVSAVTDSDTDPFTMTREFPRTFKIGECIEASPTSVDLQIQLYWRDDQQTVQQEIMTNVVKENDDWFVDSVGSKKN